MTYRILVDENTSPRVAEQLCDGDHDAVHVTDVLDAGVTDDRIAEYASDRGLVVLTHDDDFLKPEYRCSVAILFYSDDGLDSSEIVDLVERVVRYVPDPEDLPPVTNLGSWD